MLKKPEFLIMFVLLLSLFLVFFFKGCIVSQSLSMLSDNKINLNNFLCKTQDSSNVYCGINFQKFIPCRSDIDCNTENMHKYCSPEYATLLLCYNANYFCGDDGYCKASACN